MFREFVSDFTMLKALKCHGCGEEPRLEAHPLHPINAKYPVMVIACGQCGTVAGITDDVSVRVREIEARLTRIEAMIDALR